MKVIVLPKILTNTVYLAGMWQPLTDVAEILDEQGKHGHALALREAIEIINTFKEVNIDKTATLLL